MDTDFHPLDHLDRGAHAAGATRTSSIEMANGVFAGANVLVLKDARIGAPAVLGAGSVVTEEIRANSICVGVPARLIDR